MLILAVNVLAVNVSLPISSPYLPLLPPHTHFSLAPPLCPSLPPSTPRVLPSSPPPIFPSPLVLSNLLSALLSPSPHFSKSNNRWMLPQLICLVVAAVLAAVAAAAASAAVAVINVLVAVAVAAAQPPQPLSSPPPMPPPPSPLSPLRAPTGNGEPEGRALELLLTSPQSATTGPSPLSNVPSRGVHH